MPQPIVIDRPQESDLFGRRIVSASINEAGDLEHLIADSARYAAELLVLRVLASDLPVARAIEDAGGRICDALVTFQRSIDRSTPSPSAIPAGALLRLANPTDADGVAQLSRRAFTRFVGHWHADPAFAPDLCAELYSRWGRALVSGASATGLLVLASDAKTGAIEGYCAASERSPGSWFVPLTAVESAARGRGLLHAMLAETMRRCAERGADLLEYETQAANAAALRVMRKAGFSYERTVLTFHLWLRPSTTR